jgi:SAM-dependent methyltransferase
MRVYPILESGIPLLIDETKSIFRFNDFIGDKITFFPKRKRWLDIAIKVLPSISHNLAAKKNFQSLLELLKKKEKPRVLVIGGGVAGEGFSSILKSKGIELVETDISIAGRTKIVCDAHQLPFKESSFDAVIVQAVLEHVLDPYRCVDEIYRVLVSDGYIYAETPFIQQVHGGKYDFRRFTFRGHRRLFSKFHELNAGVTGGAAMSLSWSILYFLRSFSDSDLYHKLITFLVRIIFFPIKYADYFFYNKKANYDAASGFYFLGKKSRKQYSDYDLVNHYFD